MKGLCNPELDSDKNKKRVGLRSIIDTENLTNHDHFTSLTKPTNKPFPSDSLLWDAPLRCEHACRPFRQDILTGEGKNVGLLSDVNKERKQNVAEEY